MKDHPGHTAGMPAKPDAPKQAIPAKPDAAKQQAPAKSDPHAGHDMGPSGKPATPQSGAVKK